LSLTPQLGKRGRFAKVLKQDLRRFATNTAPTIFRKFIDMLRKRAHTPVLKEVEKITKTV